MTKEAIMDALNRCEPYVIPECCVGCLYDGCWGTKQECITQLHADAMNMLKAQEPVKPTIEHNPAGQPMWCCGNCGTTLFFKFPMQTDDEDERSHYKFCHYCGRAVKWDD